jgi:hypothetical protein
MKWADDEEVECMKKTVLTDEDLRQVARIVENMIYLDNAATTFPKPQIVMRRMVETYLSMGVYRAEAATIWHGRRKELFGGRDRRLHASLALPIRNV